MFGKDFVDKIWPKILGKSCLEHVFGRGAWHGSYPGSYWDQWKIEKWLQTSKRYWWNQDRAVRHSRSHNITKFGIEFVKNHLPALLESDGLTEDEIEELTRDGDDMYCRPPQWPRKNKNDSWDEEEEEQHLDNDGHRDGSGAGDDIDANSHDGQDSDDAGWETADEGDSDAS
ncbi:MAG: hypothetical protein Q9160_008283 [Pyrenula sp. 1 TL-2023]